MADRRGPVGRDVNYGRTEYTGGSSDILYQQATRQRLRAEAWRRWGIRLAVLALLAFAYFMWGEQAVNLVTQKGKSAAYTVKKTGEGFRSSVDERTGANMKDDE